MFSLEWEKSRCTKIRHINLWPDSRVDFVVMKLDSLRLAEQRKIVVCIELVLEFQIRTVMKKLSLVYTRGTFEWSPRHPIKLLIGTTCWWSLAIALHLTGWSTCARSRILQEFLLDHRSLNEHKSTERQIVRFVLSSNSRMYQGGQRGSWHIRTLNRELLQQLRQVASNPLRIGMSDKRNGKAKSSVVNLSC